MPPAAGTSNSCDSSRSPPTITAAFTRAPGGSPLELRRGRCRRSSRTGRPAPVSSTVWPAADSSSAPADDAHGHGAGGRSRTGSGMPDIAWGSGICAPAQCDSPAARTRPPASARHDRGDRARTQRLMPALTASCRTSCRTRRRIVRGAARAHPCGSGGGRGLRRWRGLCRPEPMRRARSRSARGTAVQRRAAASAASARARRRAAISSKSCGETLPIARSNSSSLIERSVKRLLAFEFDAHAAR